VKVDLTDWIQQAMPTNEISVKSSGTYCELLLLLTQSLPRINCGGASLYARNQKRSFRYFIVVLIALHCLSWTTAFTTTTAPIVTTTNKMLSFTRNQETLQKSSCTMIRMFRSLGSTKNSRLVVSVLNHGIPSKAPCKSSFLMTSPFTSTTRCFAQASLQQMEQQVSDYNGDATTVHNANTVKGETTVHSKPIKGGNWDQQSPLTWTEQFGRREKKYEEGLYKLAKLSKGDEGYFDVSQLPKMEGITIVQTKEEARIVMKQLMSKEAEGIIHACDTEVMAIELKSVGPVGNGFVTCASIYSGPTFDYGLGDGPGSALWIDNIDDSFGILQEFKEWFEDSRFLKTWHNYGFDRHVMWNEGIDCRGFGGDTMHMARLQDTSRLKYGTGRGYSLEALTSDILERRKKPMKEIFGVARLRKDGTAGSIVDVPPVEVLQRDPRFRQQWIVYSAYDAEGTWLLRNALQGMLEQMPWTDNRNLYEYYDMHMRNFGEVLTDMERRGIQVNAKDYLASVEVQARKDREYHLDKFRKWALEMIGPDGLSLNPASSTQLCTFLFGGALNAKTKEATESVRVFKLPIEEIPEEAIELYNQEKQKQEEGGAEGDAKPVVYEPDEFDDMKVVQLKALCKELGLKVSGKKSRIARTSARSLFSCER